MNKYYKKIIFTFFVFLGVFLFNPKDTFAYEYVKCEVYAENWSLLQAGEDDQCRALNVPRQNQILDVVYRFKNRSLVTNNNYNLSFSWWYIGSSSWQIRHTELNVGGSVLTNSGVKTIFTSNSQYSQTMFEWHLQTRGEFKSPRDTNEFLVDIGAYYSSNTIVVGFDYNLDLIQTSGGNSGTSNSDVANSINNNANRNTDRIIENNNSNTDRIIDAMEDNNNSIGDLNDSITSEDSPDTQDFFDDLDIEPSTNPVSDLLTMPITLLQAYINGIDGTCSNFNIGSLYGTNLSFPCIDLEDYLGSTLWGIIDSFFCLFMIYNIAMLCVHIYESITSLEDGMQLLYSPRHTGHSRVSRNEGLY